MTIRPAAVVSLGIAFAVPLVGMVASEYVSLWAGDFGGVMIGTIVVGLAVVALVAAVVSGVLWFFTRYPGEVLLPSVIVVSVLYVAGLVAGSITAHEFKKRVLERVTLEGAPLISAIETHQASRGAPPRSLNDLVPEYFGEIPETGVPATPHFEYIVGQEARRQYADNAWAVVVSIPAGWDRGELVYLPRGNYDDMSFGDSTERLGDWMYIEEWW